MSEQKIPIPARLYNAAVNGHVAGTEDIIDDDKNKTQKQINSEVEESLGTGGSVDERIAAAKNEVIGGATSSGNTLKKVEDRVSPLETAVGTGGSVDERIAAEGAQHYLKTETYTKEEVNGLVTTPNQEYVTVTATDQTTAVTDVLPATGAADTIYRVGNWDGSQYDTTCYTEYAWNGSTYVKLSTKEVGIDDEPTAGSKKLVDSGGIYSAIYNEGKTTQGYLRQDTTDTIVDDADWVVSDYISVPSSTRIYVNIVKTSSHGNGAAILEYKSDKTANEFWRCNDYTTNPFAFTTKADTAYVRVSYPKDADFVLINNGSSNKILHTGERQPIRFSNVLYNIYKNDNKAYKIVNGAVTEETWNGVIYLQMDVKADDVVIFPRGYYSSNEAVYPQILKVGVGGTLTPVSTIMSGLGFKADEDATYIAFVFTYAPSDGCIIYTKDTSSYDVTNSKVWYESAFTLDLPDSDGSTILSYVINIAERNYLTVKIELLSGTMEYAILTINGQAFRSDGNGFGIPAYLYNGVENSNFLIRNTSSAKVKITLRSTDKNVDFTKNNLALCDGANVVEKLNSREVTKRLQFVHISDPHGISGLKDDIMTYVDEGTADFSVITGDLILDEFADIFYADYLLTKQKPCYVVLGNHDVYLSPSLQARFDKFIAPLNNHNGLFTNTKTYYSINFTDKGVKCIMLDQWDAIEQQEGSDFNGNGYNITDQQVSWFIDELNDALSNNLDVAIFLHETPATSRLINVIDGWNDANYMPWGSNGEFLNILVDAFMHIGGSGAYDVINPQTSTHFTGEFNGYGQFVGWFGGHNHYGAYGYPAEHPRQFYAVSSRPFAPGYLYDGRLDTPIRGSYSSVNHVIIDAYNKVVSFVRIGISDTKYGVKAKPFSINYGNMVNLA